MLRNPKKNSSGIGDLVCKHVELLMWMKLCDCWLHCGTRIDCKIYVTSCMNLFFSAPLHKSPWEGLTCTATW